MARVFLSYDRDDAAKARSVALALEKAGHTVWWDRHIKGGAQFSKEIETELAAAHAVVVLWSAQSVDSGWVRDEAAAGRDSGRLVPVLLDPVQPPLGFRQYQNIDLTDRRARKRSLALGRLLQAIAGLDDSRYEPHKAPLPPPSGRRLALPPRRLAAGLAVTLLGAGILGAWTVFGGKDDIPVISVKAANPNAASADLARHLMVMLGSLQSVGGGSLRLTEDGTETASAADLTFEVSEGKNASRLEATLVLFDAGDRTILWSKSFISPSGNPTDLRQQIAFTAARVMNCALDALRPGTRQLRQQTIKLYLNGCAQYAELIGSDPAEIVSTFRRVSEEAPWFEAGWAKLLDVESQSLMLSQTPRVEAATLRAHIAAASRLNPALAEVTLAKARLLPRNAIAEQERLIDQAIAAQPDNANLLGNRSVLRASVGRMADSVHDAKRASQLEPLSPALRLAYILSLAHSGRTSAAFAELDEADRLWPGATNIVDARFWLSLRFGQPQVALKLMRSGAIDVHPSVESVVLGKSEPTAENVERAKAIVRSGLLQATDNASGPVQGYAIFGMATDLYQIVGRWARPDPALYIVLFRPAFDEFRRDPRFMAVAERVGLTRYWRETSRWPDFCSEPGLPYDCKAEAAKYGS